MFDFGIHNGSTRHDGTRLAEMRCGCDVEFAAGDFPVPRVKYLCVTHREDEQMTQVDMDYGKAYGGHPPHSNPTTSLEAATLVKPKAKAMREKVFDAIKRDNGLTCDEVCAILRIDGNTARPRIRELVIAGRVIDSGRQRPTDNGRKAIVWTARL